MSAENLRNEKINERHSRRAIFSFGWLVFLPILGTAIFKGKDLGNNFSLRSVIGLLFSAVLIPLIFFGIYKLDKIVEKAIPKNWRDGLLPNGETENHLPSLKK